MALFNTAKARWRAVFCLLFGGFFVLTVILSALLPEPKHGFWYTLGTLWGFVGLGISILGGFICLLLGLAALAEWANHGK